MIKRNMQIDTAPEKATWNLDNMHKNILQYHCIIPQNCDICLKIN